LKDYIRYRGQALSEVNKTAQAKLSRAIMITTMEGTASLVLATLFGILLTRSIAPPLNLAVGHLGRLASGDLSSDMPADLVKRKDEVGTLARSMEAMTCSLRKVVGDMNDGINVMSASSAELSANSGQM